MLVLCGHLVESKEIIWWESSSGTLSLETYPHVHNLANTWMTTCGLNDISLPSVLPLSEMTLEMITCRRNCWIATSMVCLWWKPHCLWLQLSPLPPLWNALLLFSLHASSFSFGFFFKAKSYFWVLNSSSLSGTIVFVVWFLWQCNSSKKMCVTAF